MAAAATQARDSLAEVSTAGAFVRSASAFRGRVSPSDAQPGRYALYVSYACPWASRCLALIALKGLEDVIQVIHVLPTWNRTRPEGHPAGADEHRGWVFRARAANSVEAGWEEVPLVEPVFGAETLRAVYDAAEPDAPVSKFTVPLLLDKSTKRIVCNESSLIIRDLNSSFNAHARFPAVDMYPEGLREGIDGVNEEMYESVNNGVYRCGFATSQEAYDEASSALSSALDNFNTRLSKSRYLVGGVLTEADIRLFVTLVRYDPVYTVHFKTGFRSLRSDCPALLAFMRDVYQHASVGGAGSGSSSGGAQGTAAAGAGVKGNTIGSTVRLDHIKRHYYGSHPKLNPYGIIPAPHPREGVELTEPSGREGMA